jgi:hypothetical protein
MGDLIKTHIAESFPRSAALGFSLADHGKTKSDRLVGQPDCSGLIPR